MVICRGVAEQLRATVEAVEASVAECHKRLQAAHHHMSTMETRCTQAKERLGAQQPNPTVVQEGQQQPMQSKPKPGDVLCAATFTTTTTNENNRLQTSAGAADNGLVSNTTPAEQDADTTTVTREAQQGAGHACAKQVHTSQAIRPKAGRSRPNQNRARESCLTNRSTRKGLRQRVLVDSSTSDSDHDHSNRGEGSISMGSGNDSDTKSHCTGRKRRSTHTGSSKSRQQARENAHVGSRRGAALNAKARGEGVRRGGEAEQALSTVFSRCRDAESTDQGGMSLEVDSRGTVERGGSRGRGRGHDGELMSVGWVEDEEAEVGRQEAMLEADRGAINAAALEVGVRGFEPAVSADLVGSHLSTHQSPVTCD